MYNFLINMSFSGASQMDLIRSLLTPSGSVALGLSVTT